MKKVMTRTISLFLCCFLILSSTGCSTGEELQKNVSDEQQTAQKSQDSKNTKNKTSGPTVDLMADFSTQEIAMDPTPVQDDFLQAANDFSVKLLQQLEKKSKEDAKNEKKEKQQSPGNKMISPLSILTALSMTANGASGETQKAMLNVLCNGMSLNEFNQNMTSLQKQLPSSDAARLLQANSIWFHQQFRPNPDFLQTNALYYNADLFTAPFDEQTLKDINNWVSEHTDKQIPQILDEIPENAVMYLINALTFDAKWESPYEKHQISDGTFTLEKGTAVTVPMMYSEEWTYLKTEQAEGFIKPYQNGYSFAALLPNEGISLSDFTKNLTGESLSQILQEAKKESVEVTLPKFSADAQMELSDALKAMGMSQAFDLLQADFSNMSSSHTNEGLYISRILHNTAISVTETGTRAGAAASVEMLCKGVFEPSKHQVNLNRPFLYLILDQETNFPIFMGQLYDPR